MSEALENLGPGRAGAVAPRRRWSDAEKRRIVAESYQPGVSVSVVARRNDVNANLVFTWRRQFREQAGGAGGLVPVVCRAGRGTAALGGCRHERCAGGGTDGDRAGRRLAGDRRPGGGRFGAGPGACGSPRPSGARMAAPCMSARPHGPSPNSRKSFARSEPIPLPEASGK